MGRFVHNKIYRIGTRKSLLAQAQAKMVQDALKRCCNLDSELVLIDTTGDLNTKDPLWQTDGKNFFTKELDHFLINKEVDLCVHSYKDVSVDRPDGFIIKSFLQRDYPHDILLINKIAKENLLNSKQKTLKIGTSSPRRIHQVKTHLSTFLPSKTKCLFEITSLRGNVQTRIKKLISKEYDAIILALAGLNRLSVYDEFTSQFKNLPDEIDFMVLPKSIFTPAPGQGVIAIECLQNANPMLLNALDLINDKTTRDSATIEKEFFKQYGGGCHLPMGIHHIVQNNLSILFKSGTHKNKDILDATISNTNPSFVDSNIVFTSLSKDKTGLYQNDFTSLKLLDDDLHEYIAEDLGRIPATLSNTYLTSSQAIPYLLKLSKGGLLWTAGIKTFKEVAAHGFWCHGCADSLSEIEIINLTNAPFIKFLTTNYKDFPNITLTTKNAKSKFGTVICSYTKKTKDSTNTKNLADANYFFWSSFSQYQNYINALPHIKNKFHACGVGKTYQKFLQQKIKINPFFSLEEFLKWVQNKGQI